MPKPQPQPEPVQPPTPTQQPIVHRQPLLTSQTHTNRSAVSVATNSTGQLIASIPLQSIMGVNSLIAMDTCTTTSTPLNNSSSHLTMLEKAPMPIRHVTLQKLEQLKLENARLAQQRDEDLKSLQNAERNLRVFESLLRSILTPTDNGIHCENEENTHMETLTLSVK